MRQPAIVSEGANESRPGTRCGVDSDPRDFCVMNSTAPHAPGQADPSILRIHPSADGLENGGVRPTVEAKEADEPPTVGGYNSAGSFPLQPVVAPKAKRPRWEAHRLGGVVLFDETADGVIATDQPEADQEDPRREVRRQRRRGRSARSGAQTRSSDGQASRKRPTRCRGHGGGRAWTFPCARCLSGPPPQGPGRHRGPVFEGSSSQPSCGSSARELIAFCTTFLMSPFLNSSTKGFTISWNIRWASLWIELSTIS